MERKNPQKSENLSNSADNIPVNANKRDAAVNSMDANMGDLRFYAYNRIAIIGLVTGVGCIAYARIAATGNVFWLYAVAAFCFIQAIVFFVLYTKKRDEFVKSEKEQKKRK